MKCSTCHRIRGEGGQIGPDLSNLVHRDAGSVLGDIQEPSASLNPDYVAFRVALKNGNEWIGFVRAQDERSVRIVTADGKEEIVRRADISELRASPVSLMPEGLLAGLAESQIRDLLMFLTHGPPEHSAEVARVLAGVPGSATPSAVRRTLQLVLVASPQDHGPGQHDYPAWQKEWRQWLAKKPNLQIGIAWQWPSADQFARADAILFYDWNHQWSEPRLSQLDSFLQRGGGLVFLHAACIADQNPEALAERIGLAAQPGRSNYRHAAMELSLATNSPITRGLPRALDFLDETYWPTFKASAPVQVLATTREDGAAWPMIWTFERGRGRVFGTILGHYSWTWRDPLFQLLVMRGLAWSTREPVERFVN